MFKAWKALTAVMIVTTLAGCNANKEIYHWGNYQNSIYNMYVNPGDATPAVQIDQLSEDIQQAQNSGKRVPPGLYAHLGMMYAAEGMVMRAKEALLKEKQMYPESETLIDTLLANIEGGKS